MHFMEKFLGELSPNTSFLHPTNKIRHVIIISSSLKLKSITNLKMEITLPFPHFGNEFFQHIFTTYPHNRIHLKIAIVAIVSQTWIMSAIFL
jgi:hypothetical protein